MGNLQEPLRRGAWGINGWLAERENEIRTKLALAESAAEARRQQVARGAKALRDNIVSQVEQAVDAGASRLAPRSASAPAPRPSNAGTSGAPRAPATPTRRALVEGAREVGAQLHAGARGAQDAITFGLGDHLVAGSMAVGDALQGKDIGVSYRSRIDRERVLDAEDSRRFAAARAGGQVLGVGAQVVIGGALLGPLGAMFIPAARGVRIAQAAPLVLRETAALAAAGAGTGVVGQAASDVTNGRLATAGDYGGAAVGGTLGALAVRRGNIPQASAAAGFTQSVAQDTLNGGLDMHSAAAARESAAVGALVGGVVGRGATQYADGMSRKAKELTGEQASRIRNFVRGDRTGPATKTKENLPGGGHTFPDLRSYRNGEVSELIESKFGRHARLSKRQRQAVETLSNYRVDHILPRDIGAALGLPASILYPWDRASRSRTPRRPEIAP